MSLLDNREHGLRELMPEIPIFTLPVGDIWIGVIGDEKEITKNGLIIERKSASDLEASILDGRYREQRSRLIGYSIEKSAHPIYIIEGDLDRFNARLKKPALMKHLTRLSLRYHIHVFQTACLQETAELLALLQDQWKSDPTTFEQPATMTYIETRGKSRQDNTDDPKVFATSVLMCCKGISSTGAMAILNSLKSLTEIMKTSEEVLAKIQVGKQRLGPAKAKKLYSLLHSLTEQVTDLTLL